MKLKLPEDFTVDDLTPMNIGVYHTLKKSVSDGVEPQNPVEWILETQVGKAVSVYMEGMTRAYRACAENDDE